MPGESYLDYEGMQHLITRLLSKIDSVLPAGVVMAWSGSENAIPSGWAICDGQNGTPDLQGRFILGANSSHTVGEKGGAESHTITVDEMPAHAHTTSGVIFEESTLGGSMFYAGEDVIAPSSETTTSSTGGGDEMSIMPPYYTLVYIMKLPV